MNKLKNKLIDIWCGKKVGTGGLRIDATTNCARKKDGSLKIKRTFPSLRTRLAWWKDCVSRYAKNNALPLSIGTLMLLFGQDILAALAMGALTQDAVTSGGGVGTTVTWAHTCTGSDLILIVGLAWGGSDPVTGITYDGAAMTAGVTAARSNDVNAALYYKASPSTGANNCVTTTGSAWQSGGSISFTGGDTTDPTGGTGSAASLSTAPSLNITTQNNDSIIVDCISLNSAPTAWGTNQTERWTESNNTVGSGSTKPFATAGATTMSCTVSNAYWSYAAIEVNVKAASGPASLKSWDGLAKASVKSIDGLAIASIKEVDGLA